MFICNQVVKSITVKLGGVVMVVFIFILLYSCIGVHLVMRPYENIADVNIRCVWCVCTCVGVCFNSRCMSLTA